MNIDEKLNPVLVSLENGQKKQAIDQLYDANLSIEDIKESLERFRTTYGYPYKDMYEILEDFMYVWGEVRYNEGIKDRNV
jgi:hypothetical protein